MSESDSATLAYVIP